MAKAAMIRLHRGLKCITFEVHVFILIYIFESRYPEIQLWALWAIYGLVLTMEVLSIQYLIFDIRAIIIHKRVSILAYYRNLETTN